MIEFKQNLHTHTTYCDGGDTAKELIEEAIEKGFGAIGFSGHCHTGFDERYCMSVEDTVKYRDEIKSLRQAYKDKIQVYCGIEQDFYGDEISCDYDYIIGSVHYIKKGDEYIPIDETSEIIRAAVEKHYSGDFTAFAEDYFKLEAQVCEKTGCDIIGHFDLISKFSEKDPELFDFDDERYINAEKAALDKLLEAGKIFEINSGAIARGYRKTPYPSERILKYIASKGGKITISADCHNKKYLDCAFAEMINLAKDCGFKKIYAFNGKKFIGEKLY